MPTQQAQQLGRYYLLDRVAFGGMAEIFRAKTRDAQGKEVLVAVKRVLAHLCEDDEFIQMLIDEARLTALLKHPNIARVYEFSKVGHEYFIAMEYVEGKDMRALLERARQNQDWLPEDIIALIGSQVALGLHVAYEQHDPDGTPLHIVHRDVSPSNVLLSYAGDVKLCDFGIAKAEGARQQTRTGVIKGKVKYMSPEQAMGRTLNNRSDLFSLGTLLYEMLALQAPFTAQTEIELLFAVRDARKRPLRELRPNIHPELEGIIEKAMERQEKKRWETGQEFSEALLNFLQYHYPNTNIASLARLMNSMFAREIEKERAAMAEFVIDTSHFDDNVGENLLADVLGPNAEYTQFTAAFGKQDVPEALPSMPTGPNPNQMRVMAAVSLPGTMDFDMLQAMEQQQRHEQRDPYPPPQAGQPGWSPSAQTMPRAMRPSTAVPQIPLTPQVPQVPTLGDGDFDTDNGFETVIIQRDPVLEKRPAGPVAPPPVFDQQFHAEETRLLDREQVDFLKLLPKKNAPVALESLADSKPMEFHEQATQILDARNLPANLREVLARKGAELAGTAKPAPSAPVPSGKARAPSIQLQPLDAEFHDAATEYLDWSPIEASAIEDISADASSANLGGFRPGTAAHPQIVVPRSPTGGQPFIPTTPASAKRPVSSPPKPPSVPPKPPLSSPATPPSANPAPFGSPLPPLVASGRSPIPAPLSASKAPPPLVKAAPLSQGPLGLPLPPMSASSSAKSPVPPPSPGQPLAPPALAPSLRAASPAQRPTGALAPIGRPISAPPNLKAAPLAKEIKPAMERITAVQPPGDEEWEELPHLDSTMLARASSVPVVLPRSALPERPSRMDLKTIPQEKFDPLEHTMQTEESGPSALDDDQPTPVRGTSIENVGHELESEFAEDTDKGDGPKGFGKHGDTSVTFDGDDLEPLD
jgi:serine/threonine-protein kinase